MFIKNLDFAAITFFLLVGGAKINWPREIGTTDLPVAKGVYYPLDHGDPPNFEKKL